MSGSSANRFQAITADVASAGVYHMPLGGAEDLMVAAERNGFFVFRVDLAKAAGKDAMLDTIARSMGFPEWFGANWDALLDCLADLGWRPAEGYVVLLEHCDGIHGRAEGDFVALLRIFEKAANEWRDQGIAFWCFVDMQADGINWLTDLG